MTPISAVIITFNEERNIGRCIDSLTGVADEIVVLDSNSTDRTREICEEKGARVKTHPFAGYIEQKNLALKESSYPHVLSLDADEALDENLKKSILQVKKNWNADAYTMNRLTNFCGKWIRHTGWYPDRKLRLFDKRRGKWAGRNPHDRYEIEGKRTIQHLDGDILHYSFYTIDQHIDTVNKFSAIKAQVMLEKGRKVHFWNYFINPGFKFFRDYFLKLGFLDGFFGYVIARNSAHGVFLKYAKLRELHRKNASAETGNSNHAGR